MTRRGFTLLEVICALVILGAAVGGVVPLLAQSLDGVRRTRISQARIVAAEQVLVTHVLMSRTDLLIRLGSRPVLGFLVEVQRPSPRLFRISVLDEGKAMELLVTVVRREDARAE